MERTEWIAKYSTGREKPSERGRGEGERESVIKRARGSVLEPFSSAEALNRLHRPHWPSAPLHTHAEEEEEKKKHSDTTQLEEEDKQKKHTRKHKHTWVQFNQVGCASTV